MTEENNILTNLTNGRQDVFNSLQESGCCKICCWRFTGETQSTVYKDLHKSYLEKLQLEKINNDCESSQKKVAGNACVACLGMLQLPMCDKIIEKIVSAVSQEEYDNPMFNVAFTLPISFYLRNHSMLVYLVENFPDFFKENFPLGLVTVGVKDVWKYIFVDKLSQKINKTFNNDSDFKIQVDIQYEDDFIESRCLLKMYPNTFKPQSLKAKKLRKLSGPVATSISRKSVESVLLLDDRERFSQFYEVPPSTPTYAAECNNVLFEHAAIYIAGRYNKYMRGLPQTAWLVQNERKMETSVHELISGVVEKVTKAEGSKLIASGREDVDVRMLGSGRPFTLELASPRHVDLSTEELQRLQDQVNQEAVGRVKVLGLKIVSKLTLDQLKMGEESKCKTYTAYCVAWNVNSVKLESVVCQTPLTMQQKTPVRVLHRRPIATRSKTVHWMKVGDVKQSESDGTTRFKLTLCTQAGTYIKEFVHGDFGRTKPSLGDLLGGVPTDCLALDVENIDLDWPPR